MSETPAQTAVPGVSPEEAEKLQAAFKDIAERSQKLLQDFATRYKADATQPADPLGLTHTFMDFTAKLLADPNRLVQAQMELWQQYMTLWQLTAQRMMGQKVEPLAEPAKGDKRFNDPAWKDEVVFDYLKQSYLLTARWLQGTVKEVQGIDDKTAKKVATKLFSTAKKTLPTKLGKVAKAEVTAAAEKAANLAGAGANIKIAPKNDPKYGELKWIVEPGGIIRGWNEKNAIEIALTPTLAGGKVAWSCKGYPSQSMPVTCGGK